MATKLLLIEDVEDLGRSGDVVSVKPGFARNFLLPQGSAIIADKNALRMQARIQEERQKKASVDKQEAEKTASSLDGVVLTKIVKVDHEGHMYGSVSIQDIIDLLQEKGDHSLEKRSIGIKHAIKETGTHHIELKLKEGVKASITLKIMSEEQRLKAEQEPVESAETKAAE